jgi:phage-related tail fiber protein
MTTEYFSQWTQLGLSLLRASLVGGAPVMITTLAIGDGAGSPVDPTNAIGLVREVFRGAATVQNVPNRQDLILVEMYVGKEVGGFIAREMIAIDSAGRAVAVGSMAPTPKTSISQGAPNELVCRMYLTLANAASVVITIDQSAIQATQTYVNGVMTTHVQAADPHPGYLKEGDAAAIYAEKIHSHSFAQVPGLQTALDGKVAQSVYNAEVPSLGLLVFMGGG